MKDHNQMIRRYQPRSRSWGKDLLLFLLVCLPVLVFAWTPGELLTLAQRWQQVNDRFYSSPIPSLDAIEALTVNDDTLALILYPATGGYLVLNMDPRLRPVIAFGDRSPGDRLPDEGNPGDRIPPGHPLRTLLRHDLTRRREAIDLNLLDPLRNAAAWERLTAANTPDREDRPSLRDSIYFFPTPTWGQSWAAGSMVFNLDTPNNWPVGCVGTAIAEVLTYYRWPSHPTGSYAYWDGGIYHNVYYPDHVYDWPNILDDYDNSFSTPQQQQNAGLLSYHAAVSVGMDFEEDGSTSSITNAPTAFQYHFRHSGHYMYHTESGFWTQTIANLMDARPVIVSVDGLVDHAVVLDGYSESNELVHVNYGWNGVSNGWYNILDPFLSGYDYTIIGATKGIVPNPRINPQPQWQSETSFILSWTVSPRQNAQYYELQQKVGSGNWVSLDAAVMDTSRLIEIDSPGDYHYRVRARRADIWWDWSRTQTVAVGNDVLLRFVVDMTPRPLGLDEAVILIGDIAPLGNVQNSPDFTWLGNGLFEAAVTFENNAIGDTLHYRFGVQSDSGYEIEGFNRLFVIGGETEQTVDSARYDIPLSIEGSRLLSAPEAFRLHGSYPNPFNAALSLDLELMHAGVVEVHLYDLRGRDVYRVRSFLPAGRQDLNLDLSREPMPSGLYFLHVRTPDGHAIQKISTVK